MPVTLLAPFGGCSCDVPNAKQWKRGATALLTTFQAVTLEIWVQKYAGVWKGSGPPAAAQPTPKRPRPSAPTHHLCFLLTPPQSLPLSLRHRHLRFIHAPLRRLLPVSRLRATLFYHLLPPLRTLSLGPKHQLQVEMPRRKTKRRTRKARKGSARRRCVLAASASCNGLPQLLRPRA